MRKEILIAMLMASLALATSVSAQINTTWNAYPAPNITSTNSIFTYDNTVTNGLFTLLVLMALFVIMLLSFHTRAEIGSSLAASSFICMVIAAVLRTTSQLGDSVFMTFAVLTVIGIVLLYKTGSGF
jgi:hypothetical protein